MNQCILKLLPDFKNFSPEYDAEILSTSKIVESLQHQFEMEIVSYIILQIKSTKWHSCSLSKLYQLTMIKSA